MNTKVLAGVGIAALAVTSGNQARRYQRQNTIRNSGGHRKRERKEEAGPMPIQSSEMYHNETAELAASISSYRYGAQLPGYMT